MTHAYGAKSKVNLATVHEDLQRVMEEAIKDAPYDFSITEGLRSLERQKQLFADKKSSTMKSRHLTGHAVDVAIIIDGKANWEMDKYKELATHVEAVALSLGVAIECGAFWQRFPDGPHIELDRTVYAA
jgi:peptidoglycan L-alanyl-D-glutamate endopeptidase CwlK